MFSFKRIRNKKTKVDFEKEFKEIEIRFNDLETLLITMKDLLEIKKQEDRYKNYINEDGLFVKKQS